VHPRLTQWKRSRVASGSSDRRVRALDRERGGDVPAVALTGYAQAEDRTRALAAGFQMHVPKPVDPRELVTVIASLAGRIGARPDVRHAY
jgi:CheY-like chemotaxis protein